MCPARREKHSVGVWLDRIVREWSEEEHGDIMAETATKPKTNALSRSHTPQVPRHGGPHPDTWIKYEDEQVEEQIHKQRGQSGNDHEPLDCRHIAVQNGLQRPTPDTLP